MQDQGFLAGVLGSPGKYVEAEEVITGFQVFQRQVPGGGLGVVLTTRALGWTQLQQQKYAHAEGTLRTACEELEIPRNGLSESKQRYACESELGASMVGEKKYAGAEPLSLRGYDGLVGTQKERKALFYRVMSRLTPSETARWIVRVSEEWGKPQQATEWRRKAQATQ